MFRIYLKLFKIKVKKQKNINQNDIISLFSLVYFVIKTTNMMFITLLFIYFIYSTKKTTKVYEGRALNRAVPKQKKKYEKDIKMYKKRKKNKYN